MPNLKAEDWLFSMQTLKTGNAPIIWRIQLNYIHTPSLSGLNLTFFFFALTWPRFFSLTVWSNRIFVSQIWATCLCDSITAISTQCDLDITSGRRNQQQKKKKLEVLHNNKHRERQRWWQSVERSHGFRLQIFWWEHGDRLKRLSSASCSSYSTLACLNSIDFF